MWYMRVPPNKRMVVATSDAVWRNKWAGDACEQLAGVQGFCMCDIVCMKILD